MGLALDPSIGNSFCWRFGKEELTKSQAKSMAKRQSKRHRRGQSVPLEAYECQACGHWHVGGRRRW